jgi:hypothetical protein
MDRRATGSTESRASVSDALVRCRAELTLRVHSSLTEPGFDALHLLREPIAEFTVLAAREKIPPERALVMFKKMIGELADLRGLSPEKRDDLQRQLVELAIESYYAAGPAAVRPAIPREDVPPGTL